jgi:hypothetical protein
MTGIEKKKDFHHEGREEHEVLLGCAPRTVKLHSFAA